MEGLAGRPKHRWETRASARVYGVVEAHLNGSEGRSLGVSELGRELFTDEAKAGGGLRRRANMPTLNIPDQIM
jgi:hypothetical protein